MQHSRRYHPYASYLASPSLPAPPASSPATKKLLKAAADQFTFYNSVGILSSWDHAASGVEIITRPLRTINGGSKPQLVGAASFPSIPNFSYPFCPHLDPHGQPYAPMKLHLNKAYNNKKQDFFQAGDHLCDFVVVIPKAHPSTYITDSSSSDGSSSFDGLTSFFNDSDGTTTPSSSPAEVERLLRTRSSASELEVERLLLVHPRVSPSVLDAANGPRTRPLPHPLNGSSPVTPSHRSYFGPALYRARASSGKASSTKHQVILLILSPDNKILGECWDGIRKGTFETHPSAHPAYPKTGCATPRPLEAYDTKVYPHCLDRTFQELQFLDTPIGSSLRALNSTLGITADVVQVLVDDSVTCPGCACMYSEDAYNAHIVGGMCGNNPTPVSVKSRPSPDRTFVDLSLRELPEGKRLGKTCEFMDSPVGGALLEWNSRFGVPIDVWALASTAIQECQSCGFVLTGSCNDLVDLEEDEEN
ncbi:hypothetical protein B0H16DRAFT_1455284 [Mycena metata]|uniref:Uncharacterized protein n=1 Tax=Mycena metata TaxID=1033252 RepID=A0AAD7JHF8_9AGAR|nr:hypothetical protein B0H16DRAFT_1455284 [Mycena metata]